jgi:hypothetical protein
MSRSRRTYKGIDEPKTTSNKMKPYVGENHKGEGKFTVSKGRGLGISQTSKLITKNANRSKKKGARQEAKKEIKKYL